MDELLQMAAIARRHYISGQTRLEIADELGLSRFKVARLLDAALRAGVVKIQVQLPGSVDADVSLRLRDRFKIDRAIVVTPQSEGSEGVRDAIGQATALFLEDTLTERDVLGVSSGRTIDAAASHMQRLPPCAIVQLSGMSGNLNENSVDVVRRISTIAGGEAETFYAPLILATSSAAEALRRDPSISQAFSCFPKVTMALVAIGSWSPPESRLHDELTPANRTMLYANDVCADIGGRVINEVGQPIEILDDHILAISMAELRAIPHVVAVAGGTRKIGAIRSVLRSGIVNTLITDDAVAQALLSEPK